MIPSHGTLRHRCGDRVAYFFAVGADMVAQTRFYKWIGVGILIVLSAVYSWEWEGRPGKQREVAFETVDLEELEGEELIVISSGMHFMSFFHYASPEVRARLRKVADREMAVRYLKTDKEDSPLIRGAEYLGLSANLIDFDEFKVIEGSFIFIDYPGWLQATPEMKTATVTPIDDRGVLYRVTLNPALSAD